MSLFQFLLIAAVIVAASLAVRFLPGERSLALKRIFAILFVAAAAVAILFPALLTHVAHFFGIGRGTDLLLYLFIVAMIVFAVAVVRAKARSDARVTDLARAVALMEARLVEHRPRHDSRNDDDGGSAPQDTDPRDADTGATGSASTGSGSADAAPSGTSTDTGAGTDTGSDAVR